MNTSELQVRVACKATEALDVSTFELVSLDGGPLPAFSAGSHLDVHLPNGLTRQYSLCNDPSEDGRYLIGVLRDQRSRGGSAAMHDLVSEGDTLRVSTPKNHFPLAYAAESSLLLAGGIGITPILCMAERLAAVGGKFEMHYCTRSRERTAFLNRIESSSFSGDVAFHFDDGHSSQKLELSSLLQRSSPETHLYVCGPKGFMDAVLAEAKSTGWPEERLHYEFFGAAIDKSATDRSFKVRLSSSGKTVFVPNDKTVVEALAAEGVEIATSCEQGVCGTCLTRILQGLPDHKDSYLTPEEQAANDQFTPCCSRAKSEVLVLDL